MVYYGELALDEHGKILGLRSKSLFQMGAYFVGAALARRRVLDPLRAGGLRHPDHAHHVAGPVHQHLAERTLSRRRPPGGRLLHRAADRARGQRHRHRPGRNPPPQSHPARTSCPTPRRRTGSTTAANSSALMDKCLDDQRLEGLRARARRNPRRTASCAAARSASTSSSAASSTTAWTCASIRPARVTIYRRHAFARAGPRHGVRAARARIARRAVRDRSATCRATPRRCRSAAAPTARAASVVGGNALKFAADAIIEKGKPMAAAHDGSRRRRHRIQGRQLPRHRHRQGDRAHRSRQGVLCADGAADREVRRRARSRPAVSIRRRRAIPTARMCARSRSIRKPARSASTATSWSTISAASQSDDRARASRWAAWRRASARR